MKRAIAVMGACGAVAGAVLGLLDAAVIALGARGMFFDAAEMARTAAMSVGMCAGAGALLSASLGGALEIAGRDVFAGEGRFPRRFALAAAAPIAGAVGLALWLLTRGPQASRIPLRGALVAFTAALVAAIVVGGAIAAVRFVRPSRTRRAAAGALCLVCAVGLYYADLFVLVRLYAAFHVALSLAAVALLVAGLRLQLPAPRGLASTIAAALTAIGGLVAGGFSLAEARDHANPRFVIGERTAAAADVLAAAERLPGFAPKRPGGPLADAKELGGADAGKLPKIARPGSSVVLVSVDALRYDRVGQRSVDPRIAPHIGAFFETAVVFDRAYTAIPHTSYSVTSLLTGKYIHALRDVPGTPEAHEALPQILRRFRYKSGGFFTKAVFFIDRARFEPYLRTGYGFDLSKIEYETPAAERVAQTIAFLEAHPLAFTWTHFFEPHEPYDPACTRFGSSDEQRYDCEISTVDDALAALFDYLDAKRRDAIVVFTADHGEEFGDHGGRYHGTTLYDEQVRVPLAIRVPGVAPRTVREPVGLVDLAGTILSLLDLPVPARVRSRDLSPLLAGAKAPAQAAFTEVEGSLMVVRGDLKLVWDRETDTARLYDLAADPKEAISVADDRPDDARSLLALGRAFDASHAPMELRPVEAVAGESSWPEAVQRAMGGDAGAVPALLELLGSANPPPVRRKAAQLVAKLGRDTATVTLAAAAAQAEDDPEAAAWIAIATLSGGDEGAADTLRAVIPKLDPASTAWREAALSLFGAAPDDGAAAKDAVAIAGSEAAPMEDRQRALRLLAAGRTRAAERTAEAALESYQLALDAAKVLAALGSKRAVPGLVARLGRERFPERRAALVDALVAFGDRRAISPIAAELARGEPSQGALSALVSLGAATDVTRPLRLPATEESLFLRAPGSDVLWCRLDSVRRVVVATTARADGGSLRITCNNAAVGELPVVSGEAEAYADVSGCAATEKGLAAIRAIPTPSDLEVEVRAIAAIGKR
jgi:arylsulfatase A-like enzyme